MRSITHVVDLRTSLFAFMTAVSVLFLVDFFLPASIWYEVDEIYVHDAIEGEAPVMDVTRRINLPFVGTWHAEVERWNGRKFELVQGCESGKTQNYSPDNALPVPLDLDWWIFPAICRPPPGTYRIETVWIVHKGRDKPVRKPSNTFQVLPAE